MRALVVSGGGSKGAFAGGVAQYLIQDLGIKYDKLYGTSTGSLIVPFLAIERLEELHHAYTSVTQNKIFKLNPFKIIKSQNGVTKTTIDYWNVFKNIFIYKNISFGDSSNLRDLIDKFLTPERYEEILISRKEVVCTVTNATLGETEYKSSYDYSREDFADWIYASSCAPPFMSIVEKNGYDYVDGGVLELVPIQRAIDDGAKEIDIIILKPEESVHKIEKIRNTFHLIIKLMNTMTREISKSEIQLSKLKAKDENVTLHIYYTPRELTNNSLVFDKESMSEWWDEGYYSAKNKYKKSYELIGKRKPKVFFDGISHD